ncbi:hypothetical protein Q9Q94_00860 [Uliginosibacterium sp. 31-16]|uniref:hypothetical protein n=1 Tax=Uliginosibacterium sp. 31-16 TaxID=3068315 RepID=UPI00273EC6F2|nr:hypothetical protein [Uliginosibacterium sp. 31-16]MDP5238058.1 hypothetical protein [Uliginosibacterium sp. 31-16]
MCQARTDDSPATLHEKFCRTTHGVPCKAAHAIGSLFSMILGRTPKPDCCSGPGQKAGCDCQSPNP